MQTVGFAPTGLRWHGPGIIYTRVKRVSHSVVSQMSEQLQRVCARCGRKDLTVAHCVVPRSPYGIDSAVIEAKYCHDCRQAMPYEVVVDE